MRIKKWVLLLLLFVPFSTWAKINPEPNYEDFQDENWYQWSNDLTVNYNEKVVIKYNEHELPIEKITYNRSNEIVGEEYNKYDFYQNNIERILIYPDRSNTYSKNYEYNKNDLVTVKTEYSEVDPPVYSEYEYDELGNVIKIINIDENSVIKNIQTKKYDSDGNMVYSDIHYLDNNTRYVNEYIYVNNLLVEKTYTTPDDKIVTKWAYDEYNNPINETEYNKNGDVEHIEKNSYVYNLSSNIINRKVHRTDFYKVESETFSAEYIYEYNEEQLLINELYIIGDDPFYRVRYQYNPRGKVISKEKIEVGLREINDISVTKYIYDTNMKLVEKVIYSNY